VKFHFPNMHENLFAYGIGTHRHTPEMGRSRAGWRVGQSRSCSSPTQVRSTVNPLDRVPGAEEGHRRQGPPELYQDSNAASGSFGLQDSPNLKDVARTNYCHLFLPLKDRVVVFSAIDNLVKGVKGQAIQNMNIRLGWMITGLQ